METQSPQTKLAEAKFRTEIANQHLGKSQTFKSEPNASEIKLLLTKRIKTAQIAFALLKKQNITLSPYLEIGSEYCQQAATLENKFKAHGFATDISLASLQAAPHFCRQFRFIKVPQRICADAYNLPFKSGSFPFVFIYETLHHFPNPKPILTEIKRVLSPGGCLFIGADPIKPSLQFPIWRRPNKLRFWEKILKFFLILPFISQIGKTETEYGIIETAFSLKTWQKSLSIFKKVESEIGVYPFGPIEKIKGTNPSTLTQFGLFIFGGGIRATCFKEGKINQSSAKNMLICPNCLASMKKEVEIKESNTQFSCPSFGTLYQKRKGVLILLEKNLKTKILSA